MIRWGILGCGRIAGKFADDLPLAGGGIVQAVASRQLNKAKEFAHKHHAPIALGSYEALASHPEVDAVYIATPHALHHENTLLCLSQGKPVLCEKAFAMNSREANDMIRVAREKKVLLMEALWTKFLPHYKLTMEKIRSGELGKICYMHTDFGFIPPSPVSPRLYDPGLGGGTLLDIGIYNVFMTLSVLGRPDKIEASATKTDFGVDSQCSVTFHYSNHAKAHLFSSFLSNLATEADIAGDHGRIRLTTRFYEPSAKIEWYSGRPDTLEIIEVPSEPGWGYFHEIRHFQDCLSQNLWESPVMSHTDTLELIGVLDEIREIAGISYPADAT